MNKLKEYAATAHVALASAGATTQVLMAALGADTKWHAMVAAVQIGITAALAGVTTFQEESQ